MNEIVRYNNDLNEIKLRNFSSMDLDMLMLLCARMKNQKTTELVFSFAELKKSLDIVNKSDKDFLDILFRMNTKLNAITCNIRTETRGYHFTLFPTLIEDSEERTLRVSVNERFSFLLNEISKNFTRFELSEFVRLESKYAKNLYRLLKQYRKSGVYKVEAGKFRELMDCPESYSNKIFMRDCVNPAVKELSQGYFDNLKVEPIRGDGRGRPIVAYRFTFKKSDQIPGQMTIEDIATDQEPKKKPRTKKKPTGNKFNNFEQRQYDYADLESKILKASTKQNEKPNKKD